MITYRRPDGLLLEGFFAQAVLGNLSEKSRVLSSWENGDDGYHLRPEGLHLNHDALLSLGRHLHNEMGVDVFDGHVVMREVGITGNPGYHLDVTWGDQPGQVDGIWLRVGQRDFLLSKWMVEVTAIEQEIHGAGRERTLRLIARLLEIAENQPQLKLLYGLASRQILIGDSLQIGLAQSPGDGTLRPVPVIANRRNDGAVPLQLGPKDRERLLQGLGLDGGVVPVGAGRSVIVSPEVARNAILTNIAASTIGQQRQQFIENPSAFLPSPECFDEKDYAERVIGIGFAPTATAQRPAGSPREWTDDPGGLLLSTPIGEVWVASERLPHLYEALSSALESGKTEIVFDGVTLPVRREVVEALREAVCRPKAAPPRGEKSRPLILLIRENSVTLSYQRFRGDRREGSPGAVAGVRVELRPHQVSAIGTLQKLWVEGWSGALLCDDMGLGKTLQALAFSAWVRDHVGDVDVPVVIVAPPSLLGPWLEEMEDKLRPGVLTRAIWGPREKPPGSTRTITSFQALLEDATPSNEPVLKSASIDVERLRASRPDVLLIGYDSLRRYQFALGRLRIGCLICDEAQEVKDPNSLRSRALRAMDYEYALVLTGTPIENSWRDLWTLSDVAVPGLLGTLQEFATEYPPDDDCRKTGERLAADVGQVLIRRTRATALADLPPRKVRPVRREMLESQTIAYNAALARPRSTQRHVLGLLQDLARISLHPRIRATFSSVDDIQGWVSESARTMIAWEAIDGFRREMAGTLVFVRSLAMQETLQQALIRSFGLASVPILNGQIPLYTRNRLVDEMRRSTGFSVMLVSPDVGGMGWNLQFANKVVLLERPWNPAVEAQMMARVHRIGQTRPVEIVVPVGTLPHRRSFDVILDDLLRSKIDMAEAVLSPVSITEGEFEERFREILDGVEAEQQ